MAKKANPKYIPELTPRGEVLEVVKLDKNGDFVGSKKMTYGEWRKMERQGEFTYRAFQIGFQQFKKK
jgi:hypothetical protein